MLSTSALIAALHLLNKNVSVKSGKHCIRCVSGVYINSADGVSFVVQNLLTNSSSLSRKLLTLIPLVLSLFLSLFLFDFVYILFTQNDTFLHCLCLCNK